EADLPRGHGLHPAPLRARWPRDSGDLEVTDDAAHVARIRSRRGRGIERDETLVEHVRALRLGFPLELAADRWIVGYRREVEAVEERAHVEPGAADDDRGPAARGDVTQRRARLDAVARRVVPLRGV